MQLTLAHHPITDIRFGAKTQIDGTMLVVDREELRRILLEDESLTGVDFDVARPGESSRAGPVFDITEPRAKARDSGSDFPGILGAATTAGRGTTHVLTGSAVSVLAEM
ncbi:MAG TPA: glycine/sarcosine/betaine reductase component B subunit, partial [Candidatus Binatia bacterium]|nr:glycine/sarcosine/betaine reductase component B subunit [Candidatus Binatia bacterium]